jgi:hypothetical protein
MRTLDASGSRRQITSMMPRVTSHCLLMLPLITMVACRDKGRGISDSARGSLPPVFPSGPSGNTDWNGDAGPVMIISAGNAGDTVAVVVPEATDSTVALLRGTSPPISGLTFDLFGRGRKVESSVTLSPATPFDAKGECFSWPLAKLRSAHGSWQVGFASGHVHAIMVDSIEAMSSADSAALAASLARTAATLPIASDPTFKGLPFRVRSAYTFRLDSVDVVIADVVRSLNAEANPRLEHLLLIGERPVGTTGKYNLGYYNRTAGAEESTQATEVLAAIEIGAAKRPAIVVNIEYEDGGKLGLIERAASGQWRARWTSAFTDC